MKLTLDNLHVAKINVIMHRVLVDIRNQAYGGHCEQIADLADTVEFIPTQSVERTSPLANSIRIALEMYEAKYPGVLYRYSQILNLTEEQFIESYQPTDEQLEARSREYEAFLAADRVAED